MDELEFWSLIDRSRAIASGDVDKQEAELERLLIGRSVEDLVAFDRILYELHRVAHGRDDLWDAGYLIDGGMSDDSFSDFCDWLITRGRQVYELALADPDNLADVPDARPGNVRAEGFGRGAVYSAF